MLNICQALFSVLTNDSFDAHISFMKEAVLFGDMNEEGGHVIQI